MKKISKRDLKQMIQSANLNLLIGAGCSAGYLSTIHDIETRMDVESTRESAQKEYYEIIKKSKAILNAELEGSSTEKEKLEETRGVYKSFLNFWNNSISERSLNIINKQINIFTTNFDMFLEESCEELGLPYNDGFSGQIRPVFSVANFNKIQKYKSLQFDNTSDIPMFNIVKLHGSLSWQLKNEEIIYSNGSHIPDDLATKVGNDFKKGYGKLALVNPTAEKHLETVLNTNYASMLRKFTLELEKENSLLMIFGMSLEDKHIKNLLYGVMKSNPTLLVVYFSYDEYDCTVDRLKEKKYNNLYVISQGPEYSFEKSKDYISEIFEEPEESSDEEAN